MAAQVSMPQSVQAFSEQASTSARSGPGATAPAARPLNSGQRSMRTANDNPDDVSHRHSSRSKSSNKPASQTSRGGRQFRVGNIAGNGLIYMRPVSRATQSTSSPPPTTPRSDAFPPPLEGEDWRDSVVSGIDTYTSTPTAIPLSTPKSPPPLNTPATTVSSDQPDLWKNNAVGHDQQRDQLEIVIDHAPSIHHHERSGTGTDSIIPVQIPHYRLGTPHFNGHGSAVLHSSLHTGTSTGDGESSNLRNDFDQLFPVPPNAQRPAMVSRSASQRSVSTRRHSFDRLAQRKTVSSDVLSVKARDFDAVQPPQTGSAEAIGLEPLAQPNPNPSSVLAATPSQLILRITSANVLDYELLSDFFLTYRSFLSSRDLAVKLIERLKWAVNCSEADARIIRVRTFVALRHWILNYFVTDFFGDLDLRRLFCELVNNLCMELRRNEEETGGNLKILGELKKCWRRTCALYWDVPVAPFVESGERDIVAGGQPGSRSYEFDGSQYESNERPDDPAHNRDDLSTRSNVFTSDRAPEHHRVSLPYVRNRTENLEPLCSNPVGVSLAPQRSSDQSVQIFSCTIPPLMNVTKTGRRFLLSPKPGQDSDAKNGKSAKAPPSSFKGRHHARNRSGSFSDALRDERAPLSEPKEGQSHEVLDSSMIPPGTLINGAFLAPGASEVDNIALNSPVDEDCHYVFKVHDPTDEQYAEKQNYFLNPGMRRFIGSMRRAWSTRQPSTYVSPDSPYEQDQRRPSSGGANNRPSPTPSRTGVGAPKRKLVGGQARPRVDILTSEVGRAFAMAMKEAEIRRQQIIHQQQQPATGFTINGSAGIGVIAPTSHESQHPYHSLNSPSQVMNGARSAVARDETANSTPQTATFLYTPSIGGNNAPLSPESSHTVPLFLDTSAPHSAVDISESGPRSRTPTQESNQGTTEQLLPDQRDQQRSDHLQPAQGIENQRLSPSNGSHAGTMTTSEESEGSSTDPFNLERPPKNLRRRPGGNLKAVDHAHNLGQRATIVSDCAISSTAGSVLIAPPPRRSRPLNGPDGALAGRSAPGAGTSASATQSAPRLFRPSLEMAAAKLAELPDVEEDVGDVESALRKLEGRESTPRATSPFTSGGSQEDAYAMLTGGTSDERSSKRVRREEEILDDQLMEPSFDYRSQEQERSHDGENSSGHGRSSRAPVGGDDKPISLAVTENSDSSIPLLERGISHPPVRRSPMTPSWPLPNGHSGPHADYFPPSTGGSNDSFKPSLAANMGATSASNLQHPPEDPAPHQSFLLDDDQSLSNFSSQGVGNPSERGLRANKGRSHLRSQIVEDEINHRDSAFRQWPLSTSRRPPPSSINSNSKQTMTASKAGSSVGDRSSAFSKSTHAFPQAPQHSAALRDRINQPPDITIPPTPTRHYVQQSDDISAQSQIDSSETAAHLPFVLGYDSLLIAQQLALIEKDALFFVEFRDLIDLRWNHKCVPIRNWVDFWNPNHVPSTTDENTNPYGSPMSPSTQSFRSQPQPLQPSQDQYEYRTSGVNMCIARFNLVSRWALSEIVLTQEISERAATMTKYIHVAQHCRRIRNWASMYQITMALVRSDCSRLKQTWQLVPEHEREVLKELEKLILPTRNFYNLRREMETAPGGVDGPPQTQNADGTADESGQNMYGDCGGCVPFIGIYTHDLIYNAQKPAYVEGAPATLDPRAHEEGHQEKTVNFDRHHNAAVIVKNLLRLIDFSARYNYHLVPEVASRCLWLSALDESEISRRSRELES